MTRLGHTSRIGKGQGTPALERWGRLLALGTLAAAAGCASPAETAVGPRGRLAVDVAALNLAGVGDVVWDIEVVNGRAGAPEVVWQRRLSSTRYGDGAGSAAYVGPCDADPSAANNTVKVWVVGVYSGPVTALGSFASGAAGGATGPALSFENPTSVGAPLTRSVPCVTNADAAVRFDVALMRPADQGFFDIAVSFNNIFCSAKLDCCVENAAGDACARDITLLFDAQGARAKTVVLGFACTAGAGDNAETNLYLDALALDCTGPDADSFAADLLVNPSGAPGNQCTAGAVGGGACGAVTSPGGIAADDYLYQVGIYRGSEALTTGGVAANKVYWNVALGVKPASAACWLRTRGTATDGEGGVIGAGGAIAAGTVYPFIAWEADLGSCRAEPLTFGGGGGVVQPKYTTTAPDATPTTFAFGFGPTVTPPAACVEGATRDGACGTADNGTRPETCSAGAWIGAGGCACGVGYTGAACDEVVASDGLCLTAGDEDCDGVCEPGDAAGFDFGGEHFDGPDCDSVCAAGEGGSVDCDGICVDGEDGSGDCNGLCEDVNERFGNDCDGLCATGEELSGMDCNGGCDLGEASDSPDCDGACGIDDALWSADCDGVCGGMDVAGSADCEGQCGSGEEGTADCDGLCASGEEDSGDCNGICGAMNEAGGPDCDGLCASPDATPGPDCDTVCSVGDEANYGDCVAGCEVNDAVPSPDCDGVCDLGDAAPGPDCDGTCDAGEAPNHGACDGRCDAGDPAGSPDCDLDCSAADQAGTPDCDGACETGDTLDSTDCDGVCAPGDEALYGDCEGQCDAVDLADSADCDTLCGVGDHADGPDCDGVCAPGDADDAMGGGADCDGACDVGEPVDSTDCTGSCAGFDAAGSVDCDGSCGAMDDPSSPDCDEVCDGSSEAGGPDCGGVCTIGEPGPGCDALCGTYDEPTSADCNGICDAGEAADGPDCDGVCSLATGDAPDGPDCVNEPPVGRAQECGFTSTRLSVHDMSACAVTASGGVKCWGLDNYAALGRGTATGRIHFAADYVAGTTSGAVAVRNAAFNSSCLLTATGGLACWGRYGAGQIVGEAPGAPGTPDFTLAPVPIPGFTSGVAQMAGSYTQIGALMNGEVWLHGYVAEAFGLVPLGTCDTAEPFCEASFAELNGVVQLALGDFMACALVAEAGGHAVKCWGKNHRGAIGASDSDDPSTWEDAYVPTQVVGLEAGSGNEAVRLYANGEFEQGTAMTFAVMQDGTVRGWGSVDGLGVGYLVDTASATPKLEHGLGTPTALPGLVDVCRVAIGESHACALTTGGAVKCWGNNSRGQLGIGPPDDRRIERPLVAFDQAAPGAYSVVATGTTQTFTLPDRTWTPGALVGHVVKTDVGTVGTVSANTATTATVTNTSVNVNASTRTLHLYAVGDWACLTGSEPPSGTYGELFTGTKAEVDAACHLVPVQVLGLESGVADLAAGRDTTCALLESGDLVCWGRNDSGQAGAGPSYYPEPNDITPVTSVMGWLCAAGEHDDGTGTCVATPGQCAPGTFDDGLGACVPDGRTDLCAAGWYGASCDSQDCRDQSGGGLYLLDPLDDAGDGVTACSDLCPVGYTGDTNNGYVCCPDGSHGDANAVSGCCPDGWRADAASGVCCPFPQVYNPGAGQCQ